MATASFRSLTAYKLSASLYDDVCREVERWSSFERWTIGVQLVRAAGSVGANIAEAAGRWTEADKRHLLVIARGSLYETEHWLETASTKGLLTRTYERRVDDIRGALHGLIKRPVK